MSGKKSKGKSENLLEQEEVLQALVIADSFNEQFAPITRERPRALIPLVNTPLIDYTIECLATAGIQEVFVFCCAHADQIKSHLESSKWNAKTSPVLITPILSEGCHSTGDALREIERKSLLRGHFVLVTGDLVCNMQLKPLIEIHKNRYQKNKSSVMTLVYKQACPGHRTRSAVDDFLIAADKEQRLLSYQKIKDKSRIRFPLELFQENSELQVRFDLLDCHVGICSPRVMELFVDNFDYQTQDDFIRGVLVNEEIEGNMLHIHILDKGYAARSSNLPMYDAVSDCYFVDFHTDGTTSTSYRRHNIYLSKDITLESGSKLEEDVVIGQGTLIGNNTIISHSVIGNNCKIGENVVLENVYVWNNVTIDSNCKVKWAMLCDGVHLSSGVTVESGSILSFGVKIGCNVSLPAETFLTSKPIPSSADDDEDDEASRGIDRNVVGEDGLGYVWTPPVPEDDEELDLCQQVLGLTITSPEMEEESSSEDESDEFEEAEEDIPQRGATPPPNDVILFYNEVVETLQRASEENVNLENLVLEINSSKFAYNISMRELNYHVFKGILEMPHMRAKPQVLSAQQLLLELKKLLTKIVILLRNYYKSGESQLDCLTSLEDYCHKCSTTLAVFPKVLHILYELDVLSEEVILRWHKNPANTDDAEVKSQQQNIRKQANAFVTWLEEAEEESDSEED
ncbi:LOW QUALITY PROTEIN: translation initiation factor eIF2B subunit epsilon-like [Amphiura filiformis]|uniref:LOW QUALITY PROTEIN: translation initiation factor eIF2B subunit epsilon-like n=1 Tax=Amphiura filiformis TaxID=82378 RepID=UPI003B222F5A